MRESATSNRSPLVGRRELLYGAAAILLAGCTGTAERSTDAKRSPTTAASNGRRTTSTPADTGSQRTTTTATTAPEACRLTPELTAGPYHLDGPLARRDITEGKPGTPLQFRVRVLNIADCQPLTGAAVDVWHCDAGGEYSGFNGNSLEETQAGGTNDKRYLRGVQLTDKSGTATFTTIFPGWYEGRAVHIHLQVLDGGTLARTYTGGHIAHVGQAFFDEAATARIMKVDPYGRHTGTRTTNDHDSIYRQAGAGAIAQLRPQPGDGGGYRADITCVIDPAATPPPAPLF